MTSESFHRHPLRSVLADSFALLMIANGAYDMLCPASLRAAMDALSLPHYMLTIVGAGKLLGGLLLLAPIPDWLREWALAGFLVWFAGGLACHVLAGHGAGQIAPISFLGGLLLAVLIQHRRAVATFSTGPPP